MSALTQLRDRVQTRVIGREREPARRGRGRLAVVRGHRDVAPALSRLFAR